MARASFIFGWMVAIAATVSGAAEPRAVPAVDDEAASGEWFEKHVRPLLIAKCWKCHSDEEARGGLRLTSREAALAGGKSGPAILPGRPPESLLIQAVEQSGPLKMPKGGRLAAVEVERLRRWVAAGAVWPADLKLARTPASGDDPFTAEQRRWWAFQPVRDHKPPPLPTTLPAGTDAAGFNEIDHFLLAGITADGLDAAPFVSRSTWLRRATFDLTGLPPTPEEIDALLIDESSDGEAYAKVVDRLLASQAYGERWGRHWLDVVRYADYHDPNPKTRVDSTAEPTEAWRYRDWVVDSLNDDLPFDRFIVHQIAGDLLPSPKGEEIYPAGLIASGFLVNGVWDRGDADKEKLVSDIVDDNIDTIGKAFLGLTLGCARCHDHKFDPVSAEDYYALAGMFYSSHFLKTLGAKGGEYTLNRVPLVPRAQALARDVPLARITMLESQLRELDELTPPVAADHPDRLVIVRELEELRRTLPPPYPTALAMQDWGMPGGLFPNMQDVQLHKAGRYNDLGDVVPRRMPSFFCGSKQPQVAQGSGRRELADWIASARNPLTARVIVNRVWQWHFGSGLVRTPNNFGLLSEPPTHPELLDWLAGRFVEDGWSLKKLHRRILTSAAYRRASVLPQEQWEKDPENRRLARFSARRLDAEEIRDAMLFVGGRLDLARGGPAGHDLATPRRSLYLQTARWDRGSFAMLFDAANPDSSVERRNVSTAAPQSLFLLNNRFALEQAQHLADRLARDVAKPTQTNARIQRAYRLAFGRLANAAEIDAAKRFLADAKGSDEETAWTDWAHVLLLSNEFFYVE